MKNSRLPVYYYPTTTVFVDDSQGYLNSLRLILDDSLSCQFFNSALMAEKAILQQQANKHHGSEIFEDATNSVDCPMNGHTVFLNLTAVYKITYDKQRFNDISTVVVDYAMPQINGVEFCKKLADIPLKKIMLTGQADESIAIEAFNEGIIDKFIVKNNPDINSILNQSILDLQYQYFQEITENIANPLNKEVACLFDTKFSEFFKKLTKQYQIVEYFLVQTPGSFLMLDNQGQVYWLIVKTEADIQMYEELVKEYKAPQKVIDAINTRTRVPHFWNAKHFFNVSGRAWETFMVPVAKFEGQDQRYYYAVMKDHPVSELDIKKIDSYNNFINNNQNVTLNTNDSMA